MRTVCFCCDALPGAAGRYRTPSLDRFKIIAGCTDCPVGKYLDDNATESTLHDDPDDCRSCPAGKAAPRPGSATCDLCPAGTYSTDSESLFCIEAEPGYFVERAGANESIICPPGTFAPGGASECTEAPPGMYSEASGQSVAKPCPYPLTTLATGERACTSCEHVPRVHVI